MTDDQINRAIAEHCQTVVEWHDGVPYWIGMWSAVGEGYEHFAEFAPCTDLNAMAMAQSSLTPKQRERYMDAMLPYSDDNSTYDVQWAMLTSTARQQAEAFMTAIITKEYGQ